MFVSIHLMTCRHFWHCVHPFHDLQTHLTSVFIPLMTWWHFGPCLCTSISRPADTFDSVCVYLMTCRHFWQCLCSSISWPADTFDSVCVHPSHDLQTHLTVCPSISSPADTLDSVCVHWSHDLQTILTIFVSIHLMTCRHFWVFFTSIHLMTCRHFLRWALLSLDNTTFSFPQIVSRVQFDTDAISLYFRHHDKDTLSTCGT